MDYWDSVLREVLEKGERNGQFRFTDVGRALMHTQACRRRRTQIGRRTNTPKYYLPNPYSDQYLTQREAQTLFYLMQGQSIPEVGASLTLSPRTIEFYVKNMKTKIGVKTKDDLVVEMRQLNMMEELKEKLIWPSTG